MSFNFAYYVIFVLFNAHYVCILLIYICAYCILLDRVKLKTLKMRIMLFLYISIFAHFVKI